MQAGDDFLADVLACVAKYCPSLTSEVAARIELELRLNHGGEERYIAKTRTRGATRAAKTQAMALIEKGHPPASAADRAGLSRSEVYRLLKSNSKP